MFPTARALLILLAMTPAAIAQPGLPSVFNKRVPETAQDLKEIERHVQSIVDKVMPATVCLRIGPAQGSGVIIDAEGHILTAGHVSGAADQQATIILPDGRRLKGVTLGANNDIDSGLVRITEKAEFPHIGLAKSSELKAGHWCLALGHPGGYKAGRDPVVRLGRILQANSKLLESDCTLVGGDSGGPLFDMHGKVIGIHSRIGGKISSNVHVPVDTYRDTWDRLVARDVWGGGFDFLDFLKPNDAYLGIRTRLDKTKLVVDAVTPNSPADKAGLKINDTILKIDDKTFGSIDDLGLFLKTKRPGVQVTVHVRRGAEMMMIRVTLGKRPSN